MSDSKSPVTSMVSIFMAIVLGSFVATKTASSFRPDRGDKKEKNADALTVESRLWEDPKDALNRVESEVPSVYPGALGILERCVTNYKKDTKQAAKVSEEDFPFQVFIYDSDLAKRVSIICDLLNEADDDDFRGAAGIVLTNLENPKPDESDRVNNPGWIKIISKSTGKEDEISIVSDKEKPKERVKDVIHAVSLEKILKGIIDLDSDSVDPKTVKNLNECKSEARYVLKILLDAKNFWKAKTAQGLREDDVRLRGLTTALSSLKNNKFSPKACEDVEREIGFFIKKNHSENPVFIMLPCEDTAEDKESRIRIRRAALRAMIQSGYFPDSNKSLSLVWMNLPDSPMTKYFLRERFIKNNPNDKEKLRDIIYLDESHLVAFAKRGGVDDATARVKVQNYLENLVSATGDLSLKDATPVFIGPLSSDTVKLVDGYSRAMFLTPYATAVKAGNVKQLICSDSTYSQVLGKELLLRGLDKENDNIVLVCEADSHFGQQFPKTFGENIDGFAAGRIQTLMYLRGTDGGLVKSAAASGGKAGAEKGVTEWPPEGTHQFDELDRIAAKLSKADRKIKAIGVIATDTYDKLVIIQLFRPHFPEAVFFTTDLDVQFLRKELKSPMQGLVIASSHDLTDINDPNGSFRDSFQTGVFQAIIGVLKYPDISRFEVKQEAECYEIGRNSFVELKSPEISEGEMGGFYSRYSLKNLRFGFMFLGGLLSLISWNNFIRGRTLGGALPALAILVFSFFLFCLSGEPGGGRSLALADFWSGDSVWLSEAIRFLGVGVAGSVLWYLIVRKGFEFSRRRGQVELFLIPGSFKEDVNMVIFWLKKNTYLGKKRPKLVGKAATFLLHPVVLAVLLCFSVFGIMSIFTLGPIELPLPPARGAAAFAGDGLALGSLMGTFYFLSALTLLGTAKIYFRLSRFTAYRCGFYQKKGVLSTDQPKWLAQKFLELQKETDWYGSLIFPPFVLLFFSIIARSSLLDSWSFSWLLNCMFLFMAGVLLIMALLQSLWASGLKEKMTEECLNREMPPKETEALEKALPYLNRGLFSGWVGGKAIQAILVPLGGSGAFYGIEYLSEFLK